MWYGDWSKDAAAQTILTDFIKNLGGSPYVNTNTTYYDYEVGPNGTNVVKDRVVTGIHYMSSVTDHYADARRLGARRAIATSGSWHWPDSVRCNMV